MKVKEESEKAGLKPNIQKTKIMASSPITSWQIDGKTMETVSDINFGDSKITADGDCSQEIKRCLLLGRKVMTTLDSIFKSRDITSPTKVHLVKAMVFPVVMYGCESWTIRKAEHWRIDDFELCCWRRLLRVPWTARRSNQSILKEISPGCSLEGLILKLKLQYFGHLMRRANSFEKTLMLGKIEGRRRRYNRGWDGWMASPIQWTWFWVDSGSWYGQQGGLVCCGSWGRKESDMTEQLNETALMKKIPNVNRLLEKFANNPKNSKMWANSINAKVLQWNIGFLHWWWFSLSIVSNSFVTPCTVAHRLLCPWDFPGKNTRLGAISFSRESSLPRDWTHVFCLARGLFTTEPSGKAPHPWFFFF